MKLAFIGGGAMGEAILSAILEKGLSTPQSTCVSDVKEERRRYLEQKYGVAVTDNNLEAESKSDIVILAIKPQDLTRAMAELSGQFKPNQLVLSIVASAQIYTLCQGLNHRQIVRVMPNTPAQIGQGMSVWTATAEITETQKEWASSILRTMGKEIYFDDEKYIDMATTISGCGPAYFFLFIEYLIDSAAKLGLPRDTAEELVLQTMLGSGHLLQRSGKPPAELRRTVTSPGGITAEAIRQFEEGGLGNLVTQAVNAAYKRAKELSR
ncbi:pyrroline-5-carboxylate reductase [Chloroflexota bacterium]